MTLPLASRSAVLERAALAAARSLRDWLCKKLSGKSFRFGNRILMLFVSVCDIVGDAKSEFGYSQNDGREAMQGLAARRPTWLSEAGMHSAS